jgi:N-acetylglucosaminyldiphosphoundecaprenol N-acetyl-beta-D-mannosaminyltransferase
MTRRPDNSVCDRTAFFTESSIMPKIDIAGLKIDAITKPALLEQIRKRVHLKQNTFIITPYSEFLYAALHDPALLKLLNGADFAVPDGIGLFWAARFLQIPLTTTNRVATFLQALWQSLYTLFAILLKPQFVRSVMPEKIPGSELVWDLARMAEENDWSVYLLGGFGDTPALAGARLKARFPNLRIAGCSNKDPGQPAVIQDIADVAPDMLFVAYGPVRQEMWIRAHLPILHVTLAIGLGGTFDYLAGKVAIPPQCIREIGLEWLYRLLTQPYRYRRIFNGFFGLIYTVLNYKLSANLGASRHVSATGLNANT